MKRRGFTIIELMMVIGIISVLITVSVTAINGSIRAARVQRASSLCTLVEQAITIYYAQEDKWPFKTKDSASEGETYTLTAEEVREAIRTVIRDKKDNPVMDVSGLFVSRDTREPVPENCPCSKPKHDRYRPAKGAYGMDFLTAIRGSKQSQTKMKLSEMSFGYPHPENGGFMRFIITYSYASDSISVRQWHWGR